MHKHTQEKRGQAVSNVNNDVGKNACLCYLALQDERQAQILEERVLAGTRGRRLGGFSSAQNLQSFPAPRLPSVP